MTSRGVWIAAALAVSVLAPASAHAQTGGEQTPLVRVPFPREDGSLTPYTFELGYGLMTLVYDTLMLRDARGTPRPLLARSVRRRGTEVTVRLRESARWHDGRRVTADDVAFTFALLERRPHPRFTPEIRDVESVQVVDRSTVVFRLRRASLGFVDQPLADVPILPRHVWSGLAPGRSAPPGLPVGSGPYRLVEHRVGRLYRFEANRGWHGGRVRVRELRVPIVRTVERALTALRRRRIDALPFTPVAADRAALSDSGLRELTGPSYTGTVLSFNTASPLFAAVRVRRAVARALDLDQIVAALAPRGGPPAAISAARGYLHPDSGWTAGRLHQFAPGAARVTLAESALPPLTVIVPESDTLGLEAARQIVRALNRVGVTARTQALPLDRVLTALGDTATPGSFELAVTNAPALTSKDPAFLRVLFGRSPAGLSRTGYRSARFDRAANRVDAAGTTALRRRAVASALEVLERDAPVVPLFFARSAFPYRASVYDGWRLSRGGDLLDKWSFIGERTRSSPADRALPPALADPIDTLEDSGSGIPTGLLLAGGAALLLIVGAALWRPRRSKR
ncbi:MAG: ABC transporter substrate-binding protein [Solirubrobacteraceae bacterium]